MTEDQFWLALVILFNVAGLVVNVAVCIRQRCITRAYDRWCDENPLD